MAGALSPSAGDGRVEGCEGGHSQAEAKGRLGSQGPALLTSAACLCGVESCCGSAVYSGLQAAGCSSIAQPSRCSVKSLSSLQLGALRGCYARHGSSGWGKFINKAVCYTLQSMLLSALLQLSFLKRQLSKTYCLHISCFIHSGAKLNPPNMQGTY